MRASLSYALSLSGSDLRGEDDAIERHDRLVALSPPSEYQRNILSRYVAERELNGGRCGFLSKELIGEDPEAYRAKYLRDLVMFEGPAGHDDRLNRWFVEPALRLSHRVLKRSKVRRSVMTYHLDIIEGSSPDAENNTIRPRSRPRPG